MYFEYIVLLLLITHNLPIFGFNLSRGSEDFNFIGVANNIIESAMSFADLFNSFKLYNENQANVMRSDSSLTREDDAQLNITQLAHKYGYPIEEHTVITTDGYVLTFHRIPGSDSVERTKVVFLMHGILDSSDSWVLQGPGNALGYILAERGFDVWMGNSRGNKYCSRHTSLNTTQAEFWRFSWEEIGLYDLPAMIDYALETTKNDAVYYIGHSQGTTSFYVLNSLKPEYNEKIKMMISLAPVAWMKSVKSPIVKLFSPAHNFLGQLLSNFNIYTPTNEFFNRISLVFCNMWIWRCDNILQMIIGNDYGHIHKSMLPIILGHIPSGSSTSQFVHYGQLVESGRFCRFDYGSDNFKRYNQSTAPDYDLSKVKVPVLLYYGDNDWLSDASDVNLLKHHLPNVYGSVCVKNFNHLDFMYASIAKEVIYLNIIEQIYEFESENNVK